VADVCLAVPGEVIEITSEDALTRQGRVRFGGIVKQVNLACVPEAAVGDFVLVHVGIAISTVDAEEAARTLSYLAELGDLDELRGDGP
jgi:hydrogenase expression/formation protein HypC